MRHPTKGVFNTASAQWRRAGRVEVAFVDDLVGVRDGARPDGPVLVFTHGEWEAFLAGARNGEFDLNEDRSGFAMP